MKTKKIYAVALLLCLALLSGCGVNATMMKNVNATQTVVELSGNNYEIVDHVQGTASDSYVLLIGGFRSRDLYDQAMADMLKKANLVGSQAVINVTSEQYIESYILFSKVHVTVSATVIEFKD